MSSNSGRKTYWESASQMAPSWTVCKGNFQCVVFFFLCQLSNLFPAFPSLAGRHLLQRPEGGLPPAALSVSLGAHPLRQEQRELARWRQQASHQLQAEQRARKKVRTASRKQALAPRGDRKWGWVLPWTQGVRGGRRGGGLLYMDTGFSSGPRQSSDLAPLMAGVHQSGVDFPRGGASQWVGKEGLKVCYGNRGGPPFSLSLMFS